MNSFINIENCVEDVVVVCVSFGDWGEDYGSFGDMVWSVFEVVEREVKEFLYEDEDIVNDESYIECLIKDVDICYVNENIIRLSGSRNDEFGKVYFNYNKLYGKVVDIESGLIVEEKDLKDVVFRDDLIECDEVFGERVRISSCKMYYKFLIVK